MSTDIISQIVDYNEPILTHSMQMNGEKFWGTIGKDSALRLEHRPGQILIFRGDVRVATWLPYPQILRYIPRDAQAAPPAPGIVSDNGRVSITAPICPECGLTRMELFRRRGTGSFFWGCPAKFGPRDCPATIDVQPASLEELGALNAYVADEHARQRANGRRPERRRMARLNWNTGEAR